MNSILFPKIFFSFSTLIVTGLAFGMEQNRDVQAPRYVPPHIRKHHEQQEKKDRHGNFIWAASQGKFKAVRQMLAHSELKIDINYKKDGTSALHWVASRAADSENCKDYRKMLVFLLELPGIDINITDNEGKTPLQWAAGMGNFGAVIALVRFGANVNAKDNTGATALHWAAFNGNNDIVNYLINHGCAKLYIQDKQGATPLSRAVNNGKVQTVQLLLNNYPRDKSNKEIIDQALLTLGDNNGMTALHFAASPEVAQVLLYAGFPKDLKDYQGRTPYDIAMEKRFFNTAELLK